MLASSAIVALLLAVVALLLAVVALLLAVVALLLATSTVVALLLTIALLASTLTVVALLAVVVIVVALTIVVVVVVVVSLTVVIIVVSVAVIALTAIVVVSVAATVVRNSKTNTVILGTSLSDRHENRLVVGGSRHGANAIIASRQTTSYSSSQQTAAISSIVDALEKGKLLRIKRSLRVESAAGVLNSDVGVADDLTVVVEVLRSRVVGRRSVGEGSGVEVDHLHLDLEFRVGRNGVAVLRVDKDTGDHAGCGGDSTHG